MSNYTDVCRFHRKFDVPVPEGPTLLDDATFRFRLKFLKEELNEFFDCHSDGDLAGAADALIDLVYVAMGTADLMGLPWQELWEEVQRANMTKVRATDASQSKRGSSLDVIKPKNWAPPDIQGVLDRYSAYLDELAKEDQVLLNELDKPV